MAGQIRTNSYRAWLLAARPKTLTGAFAPVLVALSAAWAAVNGAHCAFQWLPAVLCVAFALLMQIDANFINDYFDFVRGRDDSSTRLGPPRACTEGWVTPYAMQRAIAATTVLACLTGLPLVAWGGWWLVAVGAACVVFCFLYTTLLAGLGLGDVLVLVFFGVVPVCATFFIQTGALTPEVAMLSVGMGFATDCLLVVNNYRDRENDERDGKRTLVVLIGPKATEAFYLVLGYAAVALAFAAHIKPWMFLMCIYLVAHTLNWINLRRIGSGRALNKVLGQTAASILLYAVLLSVALVL